MKKQLLAFLLATLLLILVIPVSDAEVGSAVFSTEAKESIIGETIAVKLSVTLNAPSGERLNTWKATLTYDPEGLAYSGFTLRDEELHLDSVSGSDSLWVANDSVPGKLDIGFSNAFGCEADGYLVTILFSTLKEGSFAVDIKNSVYSTYRESDSGVVSYTMVDETLTTITVAENTPSPTPTEAPTETPSPTPEPTATATATPKPTPDEDDDDDDDDDEPTRRPTATPTRKPRQTPTTQPTASPTAMPTAAPTPAPTPMPSAATTGTATASPSPSPSEPPATGRLIKDGEGGCNSCGSSSLGILILDIGIGFLALQLVIVVLIIIRKRKQPKNDFLNDDDFEPDPDNPTDEDEEEDDDDDLDFLS
ncbi:MAG: hypothetical protein IJP98_01870 [Clostridia bacterium]|nr:hypothetical protein [Clostridia bacterium]